MERLLLKPGEVAEALGIGRTKAYELIAAGELPTVRLGRQPRVPADALRRWVEAKLRAAAGESAPAACRAQEKRTPGG